MIFKIWEELTEPEVNSIKRKLCTKCAHFSGMGEKNNMLYRFCNYSENTGKCRLCDPRKCKEMCIRDRFGTCFKCHSLWD